MDEIGYISLVRDNWAIFTDSIVRINNNVFEINKAYIIKVYDDQSIIEKINAIYKTLSIHGVRVPVVISTIKGYDYVLVDEYYYILMKKLTYDNSFKQLKVNKVAALMGEAIGKLQNELFFVDNNFLREYEYSFCFEEVNMFYPKSMQISDKNYINHNSAVKGIVHGDVHLDNFLFLNGRIDAFIDFDLASINFLIYDLNYAFFYLLLRYKIKSLKKARTIYDHLMNGFALYYNVETIDNRLNRAILRYIVAHEYSYFSKKEWTVAKKHAKNIVFLLIDELFNEE